MKHHITKKMTAILLAFTLLAGMMTLFSTSVSAESVPASGLTIHATSNLTELFPESRISLGENAKNVRVVYYINTPGYKILNCEWTLEYDSTKLEPDLVTDGVNIQQDNDEISPYRFIRFTSNASNSAVFNTDPDSYKNIDGKGAILGNVTKSDGFNTVADKKREFIAVTFNIKDGAAGTADVNLILRTMQACPIESPTDIVTSDKVVYLVKWGQVMLENKDVFTTNEDYASSAEVPPTLVFKLNTVLGDAIDIKVKVQDIPVSTALEDYLVSVTYQNVTRTSKEDESLRFTRWDNNPIIIASCCSLDMTDLVNFQVRYKGDLIKSSDLSIEKYWRLLFGQFQSNNEKLKNFGRATLNYGAAAQLAFNSKTDKLPNTAPELGCELIVSPDVIPDDYQSSVVVDEGFSQDVSTSFSLVLDSVTEMNFKLTQKNQSVNLNDYTIKIEDKDGNVVNCTESLISENGMLQRKVKIAGIGATMLADHYTATFTDPSGKNKKITASVLSNAYAKQNDAKYGEVMKALYRYYYYCHDYFAGANNE